MEGALDAHWDHRHNSCIPVNSPDIGGTLPIWRLVSRPPDSYLKSPDIKVGSRPTADRTAFAGDRLVLALTLGVSVCR